MEERATAGILLIKDGTMLLQHRSADAPRNPNMWGLFGGGIEHGETPLQAVMREAYEELEYKLTNPRLIDVGPGSHGPMHLFVEKYDGQLLVLHEGQGYGWFTVDEALALNISPARRAAFKRLRDKIFQ